MSELVAYSLEDGIATLTLNNGKVNAFSHELIASFNRGLDQAEQAGAVVIVTGQPGILSGGYDLKVMMTGPQAAIPVFIAYQGCIQRICFQCLANRNALVASDSFLFPGLPGYGCHYTF